MLIQIKFKKKMKYVNRLHAKRDILRVFKKMVFEFLIFFSDFADSSSFN